ncbi:hypothetical protein MMC17_001141 [Xylographa soralifera]|nr:hypothetical protein [Xylographa soralifera]
MHAVNRPSKEEDEDMHYPSRTTPRNYLSEEDEQRIWAWNQAVPRTISACAHSLVEARVFRQPNAQAICSWDGDMTYAELEETSSRLADHLVILGIGPEVLVPLCFEKSRFTIIAMLAVLKAGGAFVPLDPAQPTARLRNLISQTGATCVLASKACARTCEGLVDVILVVDDNSLGKLEKRLPRSGSLDTRSVAYVIFTSGSTGEPKGVVIEHEQLTTSSIKGGAAMGFESKPRVLQFASYVFDACILEIVTTLIFGGCVCVPSDWDRLNDLVNSMNTMHVTCAFFTPSLLINLRFERFKTLNTIILGGESLPPFLVRTWAKKLRLILAYGPTECCVICFTLDTSQCTPGDGDIGRAISGRAWIVEANDFNILAPVGAIGELLIEGPVLARGYLNDNMKTKEAFIGSPHWIAKHKTHNPSRFYRTGDLVKYNEDGSIKFVGRIDHQVKLRGQRLELGEVEHHLWNIVSACGEMAEVVVEVVTPAGEPQVPTLVAFLRANEAIESFGYLDWDQGKDPVLLTSESEQQRLAMLVSHIKDKISLVLPTYSVPSVFVPLRQIPLSVAGKGDRKELRNIAAKLTLPQLTSFTMRTDTRSKYLENPALTPMEERMRHLWADVLAIDPASVGPRDNFLWLGGDSVSAIGLVALARSANLHLTVQTIFRHPILSEMSQETTSADLSPGGMAEIAPFALVADSCTIQDLRNEASVQCHIHADLVEDIYPCTEMQKSLLALSMKESNSYIMQLIYTIPSSIEQDKLLIAWSTVAAQNPILRTRFFEDASGNLFQAVLKAPLQWQRINDKSVDSYLREDETSQMLIGQPTSRFAIFIPPVCSKYTLVWTVHHSIIDGWALSRLIASVEKAYCGCLTAPGVGYNSFVKYLSDMDMEACKTFWGQKLTDAPPPVFPHLRSSMYRPLANRKIQQEMSFVRKPQTNITSATIIQAGWALLVGLYSNTTDVITGTTLNGRTAPIPGIEQILGPTIVTVPFRTVFRRDQMVTELLETVQQQYINTVPFEQIGLQNIKHLSAEADAACGFRSLLVIQSTGDSAPNLILINQDISLSTDYALTLECNLQDRSIVVRATFDDEVLNEQEVRRTLRQLESIVQKLSREDPVMLVAEVQDADQADVKEVMGWNSATPEVYNACVHNLIEEQAHTRPDYPAIVSWDGELSHIELDELSSRLAFYLSRNMHIGPESLIPVCFEKSRWAIVAMLAVLKAGGACVPLDPKHPVNRIETIVTELGSKGAGIILTSATTAPMLCAIKPVLIVGSSLLDNISEYPERMNEKGQPSSAAFVVFTSGSTGKPKGIVIEHKAVCTSAREHGRKIKLNTSSRVLQFAAYTFDISFSDIFVTLIYGGCVCIPSEHDRMNNLVGAIQSMKANQVCLTSTVASQLQPEDVQSLKVLVVAGEPMTKEVVERWAEHVALINMYGPAECTIYCIGQPDIRREDSPTIIGRGVGALVWIVSPEDLNSLLPVGAVGEILIEGPTLAREYLNDDAQTKAAFIEDPNWVVKATSSVTVGRRFYKTGDLARYDYDGSVHFVGRKDDGQLKIRGQRVELGEIEYQLRANLPTHVGAIALVIMPNGRPTLAGFVTVGVDGSGDSSLEDIASSAAQLDRLNSLTAGIESKMSSVLPSYMVPSVFIPISSIPLTASGKTNRRKLQQLAAGLSLDQITAFRSLKTEHIEPSTSMEKRLYDLWKVLLKISDIGIENNFFELGGDSITAMRLVASARKAGLSLTVDKIFKHPVLSEMALMTSEDTSQHSWEIAPFSLLGENKESLCSEAMRQSKVSKDQIKDIYHINPQQEYWICAGVNTNEHQAQTIYSLPGSMDLDRFRAAWEAIEAAHAILRTCIIHTAAGYYQVVMTSGIPWREHASLERYLEADRADIIGLGERLQRFCIVDDKALGKRFFVFTMQHSSYDGWSLYLLFRDLDNAYHYGRATTPGLKFNRFIKTLRDMDKPAAHKFWQSHLADAVSAPLFPIPPNHRIFPDSMLKRYVNLPRTHSSSITVSTKIEVAWALVFSRTLACADVVLDILRAGRSAPIPFIEDLVAPTTTAVPLRIHVDPLQTIHSLLAHVQQQLSAMTPFEQLGFAGIANLSAETRTACQHAIRINIAPPLADEQPRDKIDMTLVWAELALALPFRIDCDIKKNVVYTEVVFDKELISAQRVEGLLRRFEQVLQQVAMAGKEQVLGDVNLESGQGVESVFVESICAESNRVRQGMLVSSRLCGAGMDCWNADARQSPSSSLSVDGDNTTTPTGSFIVGSWNPKHLGR